MSTILVFVGILLMAGKASSYYNKSYDGYTLILPNVEVNPSSSLPIQLSFFEAQRWCTENIAGSTLASIPNGNVHKNISEFIGSALKNKKLHTGGYDSIRLNGKFHFTNGWRWVNGRQKSAEMTVHDRDAKSIYSFTAYLFGGNIRIYSDKKERSCYFICEYPGNSKQCDLFLNGRCYQKKESWSKWFEARNICLDGGGDLASFETLSNTNISISLKNLSLYSQMDYCIGLRTNEWRWEDTGSAIRYTNWYTHRTFNHSLHCLCLTQYGWKWKGCDCSELYPFICMLNDIPDTPTQGPSTSSETIQFVILAVSCAVIFVVIIVIAAALITKRRSNSDAPRAIRSSGYVTPKHAAVESSMDFPVYEEIIQNPKETNIPASDTTYASVVRKVVAKTEVEEEHPVNSIVYAELDLTSKE